MKRRFLYAATLIGIGIALFCIASAPANSSKADASTGISLSDVISLQQYLTVQKNLSAEEASRLDMNADGKLNAADLTLMKRELLNSENAETTTTTTETTTTTTTTTTETTSTSTTTSETTTAVTLKKSIELLNSILDDITVTDTTIPACNSDLYEVTDQIYLFKAGNQTYAYTLLINNTDGLTNGEIFISASYIKGLHIWLYDGNETAVSENDPLPNTEGLTFYCEDPSIPNKNEFGYSLRAYSRNTITNIASVAGIVANNRSQSAGDISSYDYNLNGMVDEEDVEIMVKYFVSNPYNFFWSLNEEAFNIYFENLPELGHTNVALLTTSSTTPVEFAFNIPTGVVEYTDYATELPVQVLPTSYDMSGYDYEELDEEADFYAWIPQWDLWTYLSLESGNWSFRAGYYVYCLDDTGNPIMELIP